MGVLRLSSSLLFVFLALIAIVSALNKGQASQNPLINILHITDVHGWVLGHPHNPTLDADFGDFVSLVEHMTQNAKDAGEEFFLFDSGDLIEGTGLSDATPIHGQKIFRAFQAVKKYHGMAIGNHDIGHNNVVSFMKQNFIPFWNGTYLTANSYLKSDTSFIGKPYTTYITELGTKVLVMGYLYNFKQNANETIVQDIDISLTDPYFQEAMEAGKDADVIIVTAHIDPQSPPELSQIYKAVRATYPSKPFVLLSGHRHVKYFQQYDDNAFTLESGKYFEVLGKIQFRLDASGGITDFTHEWVNCSRAQFYKMANKPASQFMTPQGTEIRNYLIQQFKELKLNTTLGCTPITYSPYAWFSDENSLYRLYINELVPKMIYSSSLPYEGFYISNDGFLRYNLFQGRVVLNDMYTIIPFKDVFVYFVLKGSQIRTLLKSIESNSVVSSAPSTYKKRHVDRVPYYEDDQQALKRLLGGDRYYYSSTKLDDNTSYTLVMAEYDSLSLGDELARLFPNQQWKPTAYPTSFDSTSALIAYIQKYMPCSSTCSC